MIITSKGRTRTLPEGEVPEGWTRRPDLEAAAIKREVVGAIDAACEELARKRGYGTSTQSPLSSATAYALSVNPFQAEALAIIAWKPALWAWLSAFEAEVASGAKPAPTSATEVLTALWAAVPKPVSS